MTSTWRHLYTGRQYLVRASFLEIYMENVRDLLTKERDVSLPIREDPDKGAARHASQTGVGRFPSAPCSRADVEVTHAFLLNGLFLFVGLATFCLQVSLSRASTRSSYRMPRKSMRCEDGRRGHGALPAPMLQRDADHPLTLYFFLPPLHHRQRS